jgi:hypothetical protein
MWANNPGSVAAHKALGFEVVNRCMNLRKGIGRSAVAVEESETR